MNMARNQAKADVRKPGRQLSTLGKHPTRVTKHQTPTRKSAHLEAIQHLEERTDSKGQNTEQHSFSSPSTSNTRSSNLPTCEKPSGSVKRPSQKRKRSQGIEDLVSQTKDQPVDPERKTFTRENEDHHQLPSPSTSNSHEQSSRKKRGRAVSIKAHSEETNNRYPERRKDLQQTPQTVQFQGTVPETDSDIIERPVEGPEASESKEKEKDDPISYWAANHTWPDNFAESRAMSSSNNTNKRQRTLDRSPSGKDGDSRSYSQSRKDGGVPEQYTKSYEKYIFIKGLDMDDSKGEKLVSPDSKVTCKDLQKMTCVAISPTIYSNVEILEVVRLCRNRNEAMVNRDVTPLIVPPIKSLYLKDGGNRLEHFNDEVNTQWHESWVLAGPRPKPDLAVGFSSSAFTIEENAKLTNYTSFENLTRPTDELCFPFLMCEVKCGNEGLDYADRQNMHSCSVAAKALLKLEQKADQYREDKQFESLLGKVLVYSISHDQKDARLYGHYALVEGEKWTYYRHYIESFNIAHKEKDLLALHNFVRNVLRLHAPELLKRLQKAIAALPVSSTQSFSAGTMSLGDSQQGSQQPSQVRDAEGFAIPGLPTDAQKLFDKQKEQMDKQKEQTDKLLQQMEQQRKENKEKEERQREQMERQMEQMEQQRQENAELKDQIKELMNLLKQKHKPE
ncbi:MAG: hypothetical protein MMC33_008969 [Icmadophila ericetorum]|nr:hypothetical protein [Icmadophila ericetorum]